MYKYLWPAAACLVSIITCQLILSRPSMTFWQENYSFIKEIYDMRHTKMAEWMENVEKSISRIMADKVYTSAEFKRERDNFHVSFYD